ncbi:C2 domain-containing protein 3 [Frankliniella fusca]|uniref:C2 domain-containing protein 3 n=1 Tax=Frankliniella fusca TaxID=407009 RepID=A0AAE1GY78_9NEOP|nr:C2 domain-containing protein 3 [Frankliniella fusca]
MDIRTPRRLHMTVAITNKVRGMESWLTDVKRVRIPRPKFGSSRCPAEPPKDYGEEDAKAQRARHDLGKATEDLRRALQDKL